MEKVDTQWEWTDFIIINKIKRIGRRGYISMQDISMKKIVEQMAEEGRKLSRTFY